MPNQTPKSKSVTVTSVITITSILAIASLIGNFALYNQNSNLKIHITEELSKKVSNEDFNALKDKLVQQELERSKLQGEAKWSANDSEQYIMDNPEIIVKSLAKYQFTQEQEAQAQEAKEISTVTAELYNDENDPTIGNPNGKNVVVEFVDYNCGYCKKLAPVLDRWVEIDPEAKVIVKEFPIFTNQPTSAYSALMATAVYYLDKSKYESVHNTFMSNPSLTRENIEATITANGITKEELAPYLDKAKEQLEKTRGLGAQLEVTGTPTVFYNGTKSHGGFTAEQLKASFE